MKTSEHWDIDTETLELAPGQPDQRLSKPGAMAMTGDNMNKDIQLSIRITLETQVFYLMVASKIFGTSISDWVRKSLDEAALQAVRLHANRLQVKDME